MISSMRNQMWGFILASTFSLTACSGGPAVEGTSVLVTPVTYHYSVTIKNGQFQPAKTEMTAYLDANVHALLTHGATVTWRGDKAQRIASESYQWLLAKGAPPGRLALKQDDSGSEESVTISTRIHQVQTPDCGTVVIGRYHTGKDGCRVNSLRWASMVYPENKMAGKVKTALVITEE